MKKRIGIIPARYGSTRFPGKPLAMIGGLTMIERVYRQAEKSLLDLVLVATDDERIASTVQRFGGKVVLTDPDLPSGTDRCRAALQLIKEDADVIINIQGDEPFIDPSQINQLIDVLGNEAVDIATLITKADSMDEIEDANRVKVVVARNGKALYFSRQAIPYIKDEQKKDWSHQHDFYIHLGIYGFRKKILEDIGSLPFGKLEKLESLEQLRWLENGLQIYTSETSIRPDSVDTPEDLVAIEKKYFL